MGVFRGLRDRFELLHEVAKLEKKVKELELKLDDYQKRSKLSEAFSKKRGFSCLHKDIAGEYNDIELGI